jgi:hypothetical protein
MPPAAPTGREADAGRYGFAIQCRGWAATVDRDLMHDRLKRAAPTLHASLVTARSAAVRWLSSPHRRHLLVALPLLLSISVFYEFMASSGTFRDLRRQRHYSEMAEGFERGHLYIDRKPAARLLRQEDPFHPSNKPLWIWDATLYRGHYYFYWGPVPALLLSAWKALTSQALVSDQTLTVLFMLGRLYAGAALIIGLARQVRTREPAWLVGLAIGVFGLTSPIPFIIARPMVYEACLAAGQCFLFCGLALAFWGLVRPRRRTLAFVLAGVSWGLAIGSRVTMVIPVPLLIVATAAVVWWRFDRSRVKLLVNTLALGVPAALALGGYAWYNYARFDSFTEFGTTWQVSLQKFITNRVFIIPNIYSYLFAPLIKSCRFPFVMATRGRRLPDWIDWPQDYTTSELVGGLLLLSAWCWLMLVVVYRLLAAAATYLKRRPLDNPYALTALDLWATVCSLATLLSIWPALGLWEASMRYPGDAIGGVAIATILAAFWLRRRADASGSRAVRVGARVAVISLAAHTIVVGALSGVASYGDPFKQNNPELYEKLRASWSLCRTEARPE